VDIGVVARNAGNGTHDGGWVRFFIGRLVLASLPQSLD
jgi:hypothetical protein